MEMSITSRVRLVTGGGGAVEGRVAAVERGDDDKISAVLIRTLSVEDVGSLYFTMDEIAEKGWSLEVIDGEPFGIEAAVRAMAN